MAAGYQWYIQVIYSIGPSEGDVRGKRSTIISFNRVKKSISDSVNYDWLESNKSQNGTNIIMLHLNETLLEKSVQAGGVKLFIILPAVFVVITIIMVICCIVLQKRRKRRGKQYSTPTKRNNLELAQQNSVIYKGKPNKPVSVRCSSNLELKESVIYRGEHGKTAVRVKDTNIQTDRNIAKNGTEV